MRHETKHNLAFAALFLAIIVAAALVDGWLSTP
jgi:hypothetical protein